jgi:hypothetical protein
MAEKPADLASLFGVKVAYGFAIGGLAVTQNIVPVRSQVSAETHRSINPAGQRSGAGQSAASSQPPSASMSDGE